MRTKDTKRISIAFDDNDKRIIHRIVQDELGDVTIDKILDECSYVFDWYRTLFVLLHKVFSGEYISLDCTEYNVLCWLLSRAYNNENEPERDAIKAICDAVDLQRNSIM